LEREGGGLRRTFEGGTLPGGGRKPLNRKETQRKGKKGLKKPRLWRRKNGALFEIGIGEKEEDCRKRRTIGGSEGKGAFMIGKEKRKISHLLL